MYYDGIHGLFRNGEFGFGVGSAMLLINPTLLAFYTLGCHACRHLIGGKEDCFTCPAGNEKVKYKIWSRVSILNSKHILGNSQKKHLKGFINDSVYKVFAVGFFDVEKSIFAMGFR